MAATQWVCPVLRSTTFDWCICRRITLRLQTGNLNKACTGFSFLQRPVQSVFDRIKVGFLPPANIVLVRKPLNGFLLPGRYLFAHRNLVMA